jgi:hypothetical protein
MLYTHDAWNRLVWVEKQTGAGPVDIPVARSFYNGLNWRIMKKADTDDSGSMDQLTLMYDSADWPLSEKRSDGDEQEMSTIIGALRSGNGAHPASSTVNVLIPFSSPTVNVLIPFSSPGQMIRWGRAKVKLRYERTRERATTFECYSPGKRVRFTKMVSDNPN